MKFSLLTASISLALAVGFIPTKSVEATTFNEQAVNEENFAVIAAPYHHGYNLVVVEQIPGQQPCWSETGSSPTKIEPLFLNFDFTNACKRSSDSNSYSIRFNGQDFGMDYLANVVERDGELHLIGVPRDETKPELHIGRTYGLDSGSLKIVLDPQWRLTKRTYGGSTTEHVYLSNIDEQSDKLVSQATPSVAPASGQNYSSVFPANSNHVGQPANSGDRQTMPNNYSQPVYQQPVYQQPVYSMPVAPQQPMQQPVYAYPASGQPVYQQPVYSMPVAPQQPMYVMPPANNVNNNGFGQQ